MARVRLDRLLVERGLAPTRQKAQALILAGKVSVNEQTSDKPGREVPVEAEVTLIGPACPYVSRGGLKLEKALDSFGIVPQGWVCADIGASTGGFTDCLLQRGATTVHAVDVGYGQLDWKLRQDPRVVVRERTNARHLKPGDLPAPLDLIVIDASFISLKLLLPPLLAFVGPDTRIVALVKPQFEAGRENVGKGGVVRDAAIHQQVLDSITALAEGLGLTCHGIVESPILGPKGNREFLIDLQARDRPHSLTVAF